MSKYRIVKKVRWGCDLYMPQHRWAFIWWNMSTWWFREQDTARNYIKMAIDNKKPEVVEHYEP